MVHPSSVHLPNPHPLLGLAWPAPFLLLRHIDLGLVGLSWSLRSLSPSRCPPSMSSPPEAEPPPAPVPLRRRTLPGSVTFPTTPWPVHPSMDDWSSPLYSSSTYAACDWLLSHLRRDPSDLSLLLPLPSPSVEEGVWLSEHLRLFIAELNGLLSSLHSACTSQSCPTMTATKDWEFLCAAHSGAQPKKCCGVDYFVHTLHGSTAALLDTDRFPSRSSVNAKDAGAVFPSTCRRLYRLFAHAHFHHSAQWEEWERKSHTTARFLQFVQLHRLIDAAQLTPPITSQHIRAMEG